MAEFKTLPTVSWIGGRIPWRLTDDLIYRSDILDRIVVPKGLKTDFASTPRIPGMYWLIGGKATLPAIVHDYLYTERDQTYSRRDADRVFLEAMRAKGDPKSRIIRWILYSGVRIGGRRAWRKR